MYNHTREYISINEMNNILSFVNKNNYSIRFSDKNDYFKCINVFANETKTELHVSCYLNDKPVEYICNLCDGENITQHITGSQAFSMFKRYVKNIEEIPSDLLKELPEGTTSAGYTYYNKDLNNTRNYAYEYDMNSAFAASMYKPMPVMTGYRLNDFVNKDEIGFIYNENHLELVMPGNYAFYVFKSKVNTQMCDFVDHFYHKKKTAKTFEERNKWKQYLNYTVGMLQHYNLFYRAAIIGYSNMNIRQYIDSNTLYSNTDSIISITKRDDLPISDNIGEFKFEQEGNFAYSKFTYQWNMSAPAYHGVPKKYFELYKKVYGHDFDLLNDIGRIGNLNYYKFDSYNMKIIINPIYKEDDINGKT